MCFVSLVTTIVSFTTFIDTKVVIKKWVKNMIFDLLHLNDMHHVTFSDF